MLDRLTTKSNAFEISLTNTTLDAQERSAYASYYQDR
jgi:hypothetical protein